MTDRFAAPVRGDDKDVALIRPLLAQTNIEFKQLKVGVTRHAVGRAGRGWQELLLAVSLPAVRPRKAACVIPSCGGGALPSFLPSFRWCTTPTRTDGPTRTSTDAVGTAFPPGSSSGCSGSSCVALLPAVWRCGVCGACVGGDVAVDNRGPAVVVARTKAGAIVGGYNPQGQSVSQLGSSTPIDRRGPPPSTFHVPPSPPSLPPFPPSCLPRPSPTPLWWRPPAACCPPACLTDCWAAVSRLPACLIVVRVGGRGGFAVGHRGLPLHMAR